MASLHWQILTGLQMALAAVVDGASLRKKLEVTDGEALPLCLLAPGSGGERVAKQTFGKNTAWDYPVAVAYIESASGDVTLSQSFIDTRAAIRDALFSFAALPGTVAWDFSIEPATAVDLGPYSESQVDVAAFLVHYRSSEQRTS